MGKAEYKVKGGKLIKIQLTKKNNKIEKIKVTGDFFLHPEEIIDDLEDYLVGQSISQEILEKRIKNFLEDRKAILLGATPEDFARCIMMVKDDG